MNAPLTSQEWPPEKLTRLIAAVNAGGRNYSDIAEEFGVSKNAICGKVGRLKVLGLVSPPPRPVEEAAQHRERRPRRTDALAFLQAVLPLHQPIAPPRTCQWPMWPHDERPGLNPRFCGVRAEAGRPYCKCHWAKAHTPRWEAA